MFSKMKINKSIQNSSPKLQDGYKETINKGISFLRYVSSEISKNCGNYIESIQKLREKLDSCDAIIIGAGSGLSTSAGFTYSGERFHKIFFDFEKKYGFKDMYSGGFYPYKSENEFWGYWARYIYFNRYVDPPKNVYSDLLSLIKDKDYFVITTNVDHIFQKTGFEKKRLFYTQGDYGSFQCARNYDNTTWDNENWVNQAMEAMGFVKNPDGKFDFPENGSVAMEIPSSLIPRSPNGGEVTLNLRSDDNFAEDKGWKTASNYYAEFLKRHENLNILFLELGVGENTPVIIKYPFWQMTYENKNSTYACINYKEAFCSKAIENRSICIDGDIGNVLNELK